MAALANGTAVLARLRAARRRVAARRARQEELRAWKDASPTTFSAHGTTLRRPLRSASTMSCSCAHAQGAHRIYHDPGMSLIGTTLQTILTGESHGGEFT